MSTKAFFRILAAHNADEIAPALQKLETPGWKEVIDTAVLHGCAPVLRERLHEFQLLRVVPQSVQHRLAALVRQNAARNLQRLHQLAALAAALGPSTPLIVLKGARLMQTHYRDISLRTMSDVDILVRSDQIETVVRTFADLGYQQNELLSRDLAEGKHQEAPYVKDGSGFDLHRALLDADAPFPIDYDTVWSRAVASGTPGLLFLSLEDQLVHLCLHAAYCHSMAIGLYAFNDIRLMCEDPNLDCARVIERARSWRAERCVFLSLKLAERMVAARIPGELLDALRPADYTPAVLNRAASALRDGRQRMTSDTAQFAHTVAWFMAAKAWRRLPLTLQRRFLRPAEQRSHWAGTQDVGWFAQLRPLLKGAARMLYSRQQWRHTVARVRGKQLGRWMEQPP